MFNTAFCWAFHVTSASWHHSSLWSEFVMFFILARRSLGPKSMSNLANITQLSSTFLCCIARLLKYPGLLDSRSDTFLCCHVSLLRSPCLSRSLICCLWALCVSFVKISMAPVRVSGTPRCPVLTSHPTAQPCTRWKLTLECSCKLPPLIVFHSPSSHQTKLVKCF